MTKKNISSILFSLILFNSGNVFANFINEQIEAFFFQKLSGISDNITINYLNQNLKLDCDTPSLSLANANKFWGDIMLIAQCSDKKTFIKLNVAVVGNYIVANKPISAGSILSDDNVQVQSGRLDMLPQGAILKKEQIINFVALRNINSNQPIKSSMVRKAWQIKSGQSVKVIIVGNGYQIETIGKALTNGALGDHINVRINAMKIVEGVTTEQGIIIFDKKN